MALEFQTIGNATVLCCDGGPVLCTDPWLGGSAYFGSWALSHVVPEEQQDAIRRCEFVWFSHGHPDHLNADSLPHVRGRKLLVSDHLGARIRGDLEQEGHEVRVLPDRQWTRLSDRIRVFSIADYNQDSVLLIDIGGRLLINTNDAIAAHGWGRTVRDIAKRYEETFLLALSGFGDSDMINFHDEAGNPHWPYEAMKRPVGAEIEKLLYTMGAKHFVPFSSMHQYQREDSVWANEFVTKLPDYREGFGAEPERLLPPFIRYDCETDRWSEIQPAETPARIASPKEFGDDWTDLLERDDVAAAEAYFRKVEHLRRTLDFVNLRVGGRDHVVELAARKFDRGITFEAPRNSLMTAIRYQVFDDMLIGNFMKTTLHGRWPESRLYPDFTPFVSKYSDNGRAQREDEVRAYLAAYRKRAPIDFLYHGFEERTKSAFRRLVPEGSALYRAGKKSYWFLRRAVS